MSIQMQPGTILKRSWGYDQTNVNFFVVIRRTKTMVVFQAIEKTKVGQIDRSSESLKEVAYHDLVAPLIRDGKPVLKSTETNRRKVLEYDGKEFLSWANWAGAGTVTVWNGIPEYQTAAGFGH